MSLISRLSMIINKSSRFMSNTKTILGTIHKSGRTMSQKMMLDMKNLNGDDGIIELDKNPFEKERKKCLLCKYNIEPDYKNVRLLSQFQSRYTGRIYGRHITGLCKYKQDRVETAIRMAQACGMMPFMNKIVDYVHDPKLFDPNNPFRPHKF